MAYSSRTPPLPLDNKVNGAGRDPATPLSLITASHPTLNSTSSPREDIADSLSQLRHLALANDSSLLLLVANTRSLLPKIPVIQAISSTTDPSIMCITETWLSPSQNNSRLSLPGYILFRNDRKFRTGGGVLIYCKSHLEPTPISDPYLSNFPESLWLSINSGNEDFPLGCLYSPPSPPSREIDKLVSLFTYASTLPYKHKIIVGDLNLPGVNWSSFVGPPHFQPLISQFAADGWHQHVECPTRLKHTLDVVLSQGNILMSTSVGPLFPGSDHNIIVCRVSKEPCSKLAEPKPLSSSLHCSLVPLTYRHNISPEISSAFEIVLGTMDWTDFSTAPSVDSACDIFYNILLTTLHWVSPPADLQTPSEPAYIRKLKYKLIKLQQCHQDSNDIHHLIRIHRLTNELNAANFHCEVKREQSILAQPNRPKLLGRLFKTRCTRSESNIYRIRSESGELFSSPDSVSECFNTYFASCYKSDGEISNCPQNLHSLPTSSLSYIVFSRSDVAYSLKRLKPSSVAGPDGIPGILLVRAGEVLIDLIFLLFKHSLEKATVPLHWKHSIVTPRFKTGSKLCVSSYRGIHHTCLLARTIERIIKKHLNEHLIKNNLISAQQYGFLSRRSVDACQIHFFQLIADAREKIFL